MAIQPVLSRMVQGEEVYYTVRWSALAKGDRFQIIKTVPAVPGIYELYYQDDGGNIRLFMVSKAWYGGLRASIRKRLDPELETDPARRRILETRECLYRYCQVQSMADMDDLLFFFAETHFPGAGRLEPSGRYEQIFVNEISDDKIVTI